MKAGELFTCVCCYDDHEVIEASFDEDLAGPVCESCRRDLRAAAAWLNECLPTAEEKGKKKAKPIKPEDIDTNNFKRFKTE